MIDHDKNVGQMLDLLDELGITEDTFVMYSSDNGPHMNTWPDGAMTPFRSEKNTNWEGAFRVPMLVRWPGHIEAGSISNEIVQHHDWLPTFLAMAGDADAPERLKKGTTVNGKKFKNHIDGYNFLPYLTARPRKGHASSSSTSATTAMCSASATTTGSWLSWSSAARARCRYGPNRSPGCGCRSCSTCVRSLRAGGHHVEYLLRLAHAQLVFPVRGSGGGGEVRRNVQGLPSGAKTGQLHHRRCAVEDEGGAVRRKLTRNVVRAARMRRPHGTCGTNYCFVRKRSTQTHA
jgi:hypothetical protein